MKGLLVKERYSLLSGGKILYLLVFGLAFGILGIVTRSTFFFVYMGFMLAMLPYSSLAGDELSGWESYSLTMPCTRGQYVSSKYVMTLIMLAVSTAATSLLLVIYCLIYHESFEIFTHMLPICIGTSLAMPTLGLPLMLWLGNEKGKVVLVLIGCLAGVLMSFVAGLSRTATSSGTPENGIRFITTLMLVVPPVLFFISWFAAVKLFERREF